jgi:GGDEF domain-containing protein
LNNLIGRLAGNPRPLIGAIAVLVLGVAAAIAVNGLFIVPIAVIAAFALGILVPQNQAEADLRETEHRVIGLGLDRQVRNGRKIVILDPHTALLQRWYFELRVAEEARRCRRFNTNMAVVFVKVHDTIDPTHEWPEAELDFVQLFANTLRSVDLAGRINEGEYAVCLPQTSEEGADTAALRLLKNAGAYAVTAYLAISPRDGDDYETLSQNAKVYIPSAPAAKPEFDSTNYLHLAQMIADATSGEVAVAEGQTVRGTKAKLRRASKHCGIDIRIWEADGAVHFEHQAKVPERGAA